MSYLKSLSLKAKFTLLFLVIGLLPVIIVSLISTYNSTRDVEEKVYNQLHAINQIKKQALETYFDERQGDMGVLVNIADTFRQQAFAKLAAVQDIKKSQLRDYLTNNNTQLNLLASQAYVQAALKEMAGTFKSKGLWSKLLDKHDKSFKPFLNYFGWYDFFLLNTRGDVVYSVTRESDLRQNLEKDLSTSSFNKAFVLAKNSSGTDIQFADFLPYAPSNNDPAAFAIKAVEVKGKRIGYVAYQQPLEKINAILGNRTGMANRRILPGGPGLAYAFGLLSKPGRIFRESLICRQ